MIKEFWKKITASLLTLMMMLSMITVMPVQAATMNFDKNVNYTILTSSGKSLQALKNDWGVPIGISGKYANNKVEESSIFQFVITNDGKYYIKSVALSEGEKNSYLKYENPNANAKYVFANTSDNPGDDFKFEIEKMSDTTGTIKRGNYYLYIEDEQIKGTEEGDKAEVFTFVKNVEVLDMTVSIEHIATGKYVTFKDQDANANYAPIQLAEVNSLTDHELFNPVYTTNTVTANEKSVSTVAFQSKENPDLLIASAFWDTEGNVGVPKVGAYNHAPGGFESIIVSPNGDGTVSFKDSYSGTYITVNEEGVLTPNYDGQLTDNEKFIIHTEIAPSKVVNVEVSDRGANSISLKWNEINDSLLSGYKVLRSQSDDGPFTLVENGNTGNNTFIDNTVSPSSTYYYKVYAVNEQGNKENSIILNGEESDVVEVTTLAGERPYSPTNVKIKDKKGSVELSWEASQTENVTYEVYAAPSNYADYKKLDDVSVEKDQLSCTISYNKDTKYQYYKVVAKSKLGILSDVNAIEEGISLEKELFGDHTWIFAETDKTSIIDKKLSDLFATQNDRSADAQFQAEHYQVYFKPGDYQETACMNLGFYTSFNGLGKLPTDVKLNNIAIPAYLTDDNATCNFWRSAENLAIYNTGNEQGKAQYGSYRPEQLNWAVAQAAPLRRIYSERAIAYDWNYGWASGGYVADSKIDGSYYDDKKAQDFSAGTWSGQQFYTRNSELKKAGYGCTLNNFYQGVIAPGLPDGTNGEAELKDGNGNLQGYSNWNIPDADGNQQVVTNVLNTKKIAEKPFLYINDDGEYSVFVPKVLTDRKGTSWSEDNMGEGESIPLSKFYIAKPSDTAAEINKQIEAGKNIYFTPGVYKAETPIKVNKKDTIILGTGMATIIPTNSEAAMEVSDVDGVRIAGLIFDAGANSEYLLKVGEEGSKASHSDDPTILSDLFFRIGGTTSEKTSADNALVINNNDTITDHFWIWRADHGTGVSWSGNPAQHGLVVNGDDVTCYALFNEHFENYTTLWNGERGATYFYQNETAYDAISQNKDNKDAWLSHNGTTKGYASYKVANNVEKHYAVGLGVYNVFIYTGGGEFNKGQYDGGAQIELDNGIEVPNKSGVVVENACMQTFAKSGVEGGLYQTTNHIINGVGGSVSSGFKREETRDEDGSLNGNLLDKDGKPLPTKIYKVESENEHGLKEFKYVIRELDDQGREIVLDGDGNEYDLDKLLDSKYSYSIDPKTGVFSIYDPNGNYINPGDWQYIEEISTRKNPIGKAVKGNGWARVFLTRYCDGEATFNTENPGENDSYLTTLKNVKQLGEEIDVETLQELQALVSENLVSTDYTSDTWNKYISVLNEAKKFVSEDYLKYDAKQVDVSSAIVSLTAARKGLEKVADKAELQDTYDHEKELNKNDYTSDSWSRLARAIEHAEEVLSDENATQEEVDEANKELNDADKALEKVEPSNPDNGNDKPSDPNGGNDKPSNPNNGTNGDNTSNGNSNGNGNSTNSGDNKTNSTSKGNSSTKSNTQTHSTRKNVKTGDDSAIALFATLALLSAITYIVIKRRKHEN